MSDWRTPSPAEQYEEAHGLYEEHQGRHDCWYDFCPGRQSEPQASAYGLFIPEVWADKTGVAILDPDGWRIDGKDFEEPITFEEFEERLISCTIAFRVRDD